MVRSPERLALFEQELSRTERPDFHRNLRLYEALYRQAVALGVLPGRDPLAGLEVDVRLARALNV